MNKRASLLLILIILAHLLPSAQAQGTVEDLLSRINGLRASLGLSPYALNPQLSAAARNHAQWMTNSGTVSHYGADGSGPRARANQAGYGSPWVIENIFMGSATTTTDAWNFWINEPAHYAGLTSPNYMDIGIGIITGTNGNAFVLVFGNPNPGNTNSTAGNNPDTGGNTGASAQPAPPSFVVGKDAHGNIMHEVQPGDTLGDIALIYGHTWEDIPYIRELNGLENNLLDVGGVILVPPREGTYTPTPESNESEEEEKNSPAIQLIPKNTATPTTAPDTGTDIEFPKTGAEPEQENQTGIVPESSAISTNRIEPVVFNAAPTESLIPTDTLTPAPNATSTPSPTIQLLIRPISDAADPTRVALPPTPIPAQAIIQSVAGLTPTGELAPVLLVAIVIQTGIILSASALFIRRWRNRTSL